MNETTTLIIYSKKTSEIKPLKLGMLHDNSSNEEILLKEQTSNAFLEMSELQSETVHQTNEINTNKVRTTFKFEQSTKCELN